MYAREVLLSTPPPNVFILNIHGTFSIFLSVYIESLASAITEAEENCDQVNKLQEQALGSMRLPTSTSIVAVTMPGRILLHSFEAGTRFGQDQVDCSGNDFKADFPVSIGFAIEVERDGLLR